MRISAEVVRRGGLLTSALFIVASLHAGPHDGLKKRIAVMDMTLATTTLSQTSPGSVQVTSNAQIPPPADFALGLTEMLTTELVKTGQFIVLERKAFTDVTAEQDLVGAGRVSTETGAKSGSIIGAQAMIRCAVTEYSYSQSGSSGALKMLPGLNLGASVVRANVGIDVRIYDAKTSQVLVSTVARGSATSAGADVKYADQKFEGGLASFIQTPLGRASRAAIQDAVRFIVARLSNAPWEARVVRADAGLVYLNVGDESGISVGTTFGIYRPAEPLIDPASGVDLGTPDRQIGVVRITEVTPKYSLAEFVSGAGAQRNDVVRPVAQHNR